VKIDVLTLFPDAFGWFMEFSMIKRAIEKKKASVRVVNIRDFAHDKHKTCDDRPFGGGPGMLMKPEPIFEAAEAVLGKKRSKKTRFIYMTPQGERFSQKKAAELAQAEHLVFLCGHYEGVDQRVVEGLVTDEISIGDYVLTGGEIPAMAVMEAVIRLLPGVLGCGESKEFESFNENLLEYPQYTRPAVYRGMKVPSVLLSGHHKAIEEWRREESQRLTLKRRPDLLGKSKKTARKKR
jgi:tRNA (guanine37-N1)-methyltransferase